MEQRIYNKRKPYDDTALSRLFRVKKVQVEMLRDRGYEIGDEVFLLDPKYTVERFANDYGSLAVNNTTIRSLLSGAYNKVSVLPTGEYTLVDTIYVYYFETPKTTKTIGQDQVKTMFTFLEGRQIYRHVIAMAEVELTNDSRNLINEKVPAYTMEVFLYSELIINPTHHAFVPKHEIMSDEDASQFLKNNHISIQQLPVILTTDIIARYYGARKGSVMMIYRSNLGNESMISNSIAYRAVKEPLPTKSKSKKSKGKKPKKKT